MKNIANKNIKKYIGIGIFSALAFVVALVCNIIPPIAGFLSLDVKDAVIAIASFVYGPVSGIIIAFIAAFIELITISTTAWYGFIMNFASSAIFSFTASFIYRRHRSINGALVAFFAAVIATTAVMLILNIFVTPLYLIKMLGMPKTVATETVMGMLAKILLPFNSAKALLNSAVAMLLYKPLTVALSKASIIEMKAKSLSFNKYSVIILIVGTLALITSITVFLLIS